jgi:hypothetical protein
MLPDSHGGLLQDNAVVRLLVRLLADQHLTSRRPVFGKTGFLNQQTVGSVKVYPKWTIAFA